MVYCRSFNREPFFVPFNKGIKTCHIFRIRLHLNSCFSCKYFFCQEICQIFIFLTMRHIGCEQGNSPGSAFSRGFHNGNRCVNCSGQNTLTDSFCLEKSAMSQNPVKFYMLFFKHDVHSDFQCSKRGVKMYSHEVCEIKAALRCPDK